jgi:hypothetical protein
MKTVALLSSAALLAAACSSSSSPAPAPASPPIPVGATPFVGCATQRPAVAHHAGGVALSPQPADLPVPCVSSPGAASADPTLVRTESGKLLLAPANIPGFASSSDEGTTWVTSSPPAPPSGTLLHPWLWHDAASHRIFYNVYSLNAGTCSDNSGANSGATLWFSDDEGTSWTSQPVGCGSQDWGKVITGPAATAARKAALAQSGYPDMVYYCATGPVAITGPNHICYRSTDGGKTFTRGATDPVASTDGYPAAGAVGPDGKVYVPKGSHSGLAIAVSTDEGDSWVDHVVPGSHFVGTSSRNWLSMNVAVDAGGTLYAVWSDDHDLLPYVAYSKDEGATWSSPLAIGAPGVKTSTFPSITAGSAGTVAVAYYGSPQARGSADGYFNTDGLPYDAYVVVTDDLFAPSPTFFSATFNDPTKPVITGLTYAVSEYAGYPVFASDGSIWSAYLDGSNGFAGRLTRPGTGDGGP